MAMFPECAVAPDRLGEHNRRRRRSAFSAVLRSECRGLTNVYFPQLVGASTFDVNITRTNEAFKDPISLAVEGLPPGIKAEIAPVDDGPKALSRVAQRPGRSGGAGSSPFASSAPAEFQEQTRTVVLQNLTLRVTKPLVVSVAMAGPIVAGGGQQADVQLQRFGDEPQPVRLQVSDGPAGLSAPIFVTVPATQSSQNTVHGRRDRATGQIRQSGCGCYDDRQGAECHRQSKPATVEIQPKANSIAWRALL